MNSKSPVLRVAQVASLLRQIAAIWASAVETGNPARSRAMKTLAYARAAYSSKPTMARVSRYDAKADSTAALNRDLRRPSGSLRTPASNSAMVTVVIATSSVTDSSHVTTRDDGAGLKNSETTLVSRMIKRSPQPVQDLCALVQGVFQPRQLPARPATAPGRCGDGSQLG